MRISLSPIILFIITVASCQYKYDWQKENISDTLKLKHGESIKGGNFSKIYFPKMQLADGNSLSISCESYGCFDYENETIKIKKKKDYYIVSYSIKTEGKSNDIISGKTMQASFETALEDFSTACKKQLLNNTADTSENSIYTTETVHRIIITDGLHPFSFFIDNKNIFEVLKSHVDNSNVIKTNTGS